MRYDELNSIRVIPISVPNFKRNYNLTFMRYRNYLTRDRCFESSTGKWLMGKCTV